MTRSGAAALVAIGLAAAAAASGCGGDPASTPPGAASDPRPPTSGSAAPALSVSDFPEPPRKVTPGPAPSTESEAMRERVVLGLLEGSAPIDEIPVEATDDGAPLDPTLRSRLSTTGAQRVPVRVGPVTTTDGLPKEVVARILRQSLGRVRACYEKGLTTNPNLIGRLDVRFTIGKTGSVYEPVVTGDLPEPATIACIRNVTAAMTFPAPEGTQAVTATTTYTFTPFH